MKLGELLAFMQRAIQLNPGMENAPIHEQHGGEITGYGLGDHIMFTSDYYPKHAEESKWSFFDGIFSEAGVPVDAHWELANGYWPRAYVKDVIENPWWLVLTPIGLIEIGWRKRVISINWEATGLPHMVTSDAVTKDEYHVHACSREKAVEYLKALFSDPTGLAAVP